MPFFKWTLTSGSNWSMGELWRLHNLFCYKGLYEPNLLFWTLGQHTLDPLVLHKLSTSQQSPSKTFWEFAFPNCVQHGIVMLCKEAPLRGYPKTSNREWSCESHHVRWIRISIHPMLAKGVFPTLVHHQKTTCSHRCPTCGMSDPCIISLKNEKNNFKGLNFHNLMHE